MSSTAAGSERVGATGAQASQRSLDRIAAALYSGLMILLAIDTALANCSVGLSIEGRVVLRERTIGRGHAEVLMPEIAELLAETGVGAGDVGRIAVTVGPGSFTGLRVGISAARGLALVGGTPVVGISTLRAHAAHAASLRDPADRRPILALLPARGEELFAQLFSAEAMPLEPPAVTTVAEVASRLEREQAALAGAGAQLLAEPPAALHLLSSPAMHAVIALGLELEPADHPPRPLYIKPPDAVPAKAQIARR